MESASERELAPRLVECGVESSLENAKRIVRQHMRPSILQAHQVLQRCEFAFATTEILAE
jgi:hypothetical protein